MRVRLPIITLILLGTYLNLTYAAFYHSIGKWNLPSRNIEKIYYLPINPTPPKNQFTYLALGDSLTAGVGATSFKNTFPYLISEKLSQNNSSVKLINLSYPGTRIDDVLKTQLPQAPPDPNLITIFIGINDIHNFTPESTFDKKYRFTVNQLKKHPTSKIYLINLPLLGSSQILPFPYNYLLNLKTQRFNKIIQDIAKDQNLGYIDLYTKSLKPFSKDKSYYSNDQFHPSDKGYALWAKIINDYQSSRR